MAFNALFEFVLTVEDFFNIDLQKQGLYRVRIVLQNLGGKENPVPGTQTVSKIISQNHKIISPKAMKTLAQIRFDESRVDAIEDFVTKPFVIKYQNEEVRVKEAPVFRCSVPIREEAPTFVCTFQLLYYETKADDDVQELMRQKLVYGTAAERQFTFKIEEGFLAEYLQVVFRERFSCAMRVGIFGTLLKAEPVASTDELLQMPQIALKKLYRDSVSILYSSLQQLKEFYTKYKPNELPSETMSSTFVVRDDRIEIIDDLLGSTSKLSKTLNQMWVSFTNLLASFRSQIVNDLQKEFEGVKERRYQALIHSNVRDSEYTSIINRHQDLVRHFRKRRLSISHFQQVKPQSEDKSERMPPPLLFESMLYVNPLQRTTTVAKNSFGIHLFVLVHGLQGNASNMAFIKRAILLKYPKSIVLCSATNELSTEDNIELVLGPRLATEVKAFVEQYCPGSLVEKISFIGHSLGGIIVRAALPFLEGYRSKMHSFISLSSPHLGYQSSTNALVSAGMWFLKRLRRGKSLKQLCLSDATDLRQCYLYRLNQRDEMSWFTHVALVGSQQDSYVPFDSALAEIPETTPPDSEPAEMQAGFLNSLSTKVLYRINAYFDETDARAVDRIIGRSAHIQPIDNSQLMEMLIIKYKFMFE